VPTSALRDHVRTHVEDRPGVYQMLGVDGQPIYVGKSIRVRTRLLSYFRAPAGDKAANLIRETGRIRWEYIPNEFSALVREMKLIQRWQPRFNVQHKRKRTYAFVKLAREVAPRIVPVTRVIADGSLYFGPFPAVGKVGAAEILLVARWFELRPRELKRTATPKQWLETGVVGRPRRAKRSVAASRGAPA